MTRNKNLATLTLMIGSIALLAVLEVLWLRSSYEKAFFDFSRETNTIFRNTVMAMRDSIFVRNIKPLSEDSLSQIITSKFPVSDGSAKMITRRGTVRREMSNVQIFVAADSGNALSKDLLKPLASNINAIRIDQKDGAQRSFVIQMMPDTLHLDSLSDQYKIALARAGLTVPFTVKHLTMHSVYREKSSPLLRFEPEPMRELPMIKENLFKDTVMTEPIRINPLHQYAASLSGVRKIVFREITPQILFSVFLTLTTGASFLFMYRNIRSQQRLMQAKNDFISNITHELKTPVATVSVALEALKDFNAIENPKLSQEYLEIAQRELSRLTDMTDKILKASVFEEKGMVFTPEKTDLNVLLDQVLKSNKAVFENRDADIKVTHDGSHFEVYGSVVHLTSVIHNLIDNALKYSPGKPVIQIHLTETTHEVVLAIKDHGIGIPAEYLKKIFEKFFRVPTGDIHNIKGYGLGLSHVSSIVKSHNGKIDVTSEPNNGSEFKITLHKPAYEFKMSLPLP